MKEFVLFKEKKEVPPKREDFLKKALHDCQQALDDAYRGLQNTNEPDLIDRYIYELNAANMRYKVLLRDIKEIAASQERDNSVLLSEPILSHSLLRQPATLPEPAPVSANISSTNLDTDTSLLNRSFR